MMSLKNAFIWLLIAFFSFSCQSNTNLPQEENIVHDTVHLDRNAPVNESEAGAKTPAKILENIVTEWNIAHNSKDYSTLQKLYAEEVNLYGKVYSNADAIAHKKDFLSGKSQTYQQILGGADVVIHSAYVAKASFIKKVVSGNSATSYNAYLLLEKFDNKWRIVAESDEKSDADRVKQKLSGGHKESLTICDKLAADIFRSSKTVQQLLKVPNANYRIEYRPGEPDNPNNHFWFLVYVNTPNSASTETYGRFQVDPLTGELAEFDAIENKAKPIASGSAEKQEFVKTCGDKL